MAPIAQRLELLDQALEYHQRQLDLTPEREQPRTVELCGSLDDARRILKAALSAVDSGSTDWPELLIAAEDACNAVDLDLTSWIYETAWGPDRRLGQAVRWKNKQRRPPKWRREARARAGARWSKDPEISERQLARELAPALPGNPSWETVRKHIADLRPSMGR